MARSLTALCLRLLVLLSVPGAAGAAALWPAQAEQSTPTGRVSSSNVNHPILEYSTYYGSTGGGERNSTSGDAIAIDPEGNAYITGMTSAANLPLKNPYDARPSGSLWDGYIAKLDPTGSSLRYGTYFGGGRETIVKGVAVDSRGNIYLTGSAREGFLPHNSPIQQAVRGDADAFVAKLNADGQTLVYAALLGGADFDTGYRIAVDAQGNAFVTGETRSTDFTTVAPLQRFAGPGRGGGDAFVAKIAPDGSRIIYATYLGGGGPDAGYGITVDGAGAAYVTGYTASDDFPGAGGSQHGRAGDTDAFVAKVSPDGASLVYATYLGGRASDSGSSIVVDPAGNAYVVGATGSADFPLAHAVQSTFNAGAQTAILPQGLRDAFVTELSPDGRQLLFSTYLGGTGEDRGLGIGRDAAGSIYAGGQTSSFDFPLLRPLQDHYAGDNNGTVTDSFITKFAPGGTSVLYSTYFGSVSSDNLHDLAVDAAGNVYFTGDVDAPSPDFPLAGPPFQSTNKGIRNAFVAKLTDDYAGPPQPLPLLTPRPQNTNPGRPPAGYEKRWLQGIPCAPPCWEDITPGATTLTDAVQLLRRDRGIQPDSVLSRPSGQPEEHAGYIQWKWLGSDNGGQMIYQGASSPATVTDIWPELNGIPGGDASVSLGQVIAAYGEPSHIHATGFYGMHGDGPFYTATLYWEKRGMALEPSVGYDGKPHLGPDLRLDSITFSTNPVRPQRPTFAGMADDPSTGPQPWHGYQSFDVYCRNTSISAKPGSPCPEERLSSSSGLGALIAVFASAMLLGSIAVVRARARLRARNMRSDK